MSRVAPTRGSKTLSFLFISLSALLLYLDTTYKSFESIKNIYKSFAISTSYILKKSTIDPISYIYELSLDKSYLLKENKELKLAYLPSPGVVRLRLSGISNDKSKILRIIWNSA